MVIRKGHHPEGLGSGHREGEDKEVVIVVLTGAPNLLLEALTLNGGYSHHLTSHTLSPIGNSGLLGRLRDRLYLLVVSYSLTCNGDTVLAVLSVGIS